MNVARQATLIAFYGAKSAAIARLIALSCEKVEDAVGKQFLPYEMDQIHATVVGLERAPGPALCNLNFLRYRSRSVEMDLYGFLEYLKSSAPIPFSIQIGGFADRDYSFKSRGQRPYNRSFSIQGDKAVVLGWPRTAQPNAQSLPAPVGIQDAQFYPRTLNEIRLAAQEFGILHAYHRDPSDVDNDFYFRIGLLSPPRVNELKRRKLEANVQHALCNERPAVSEVALSDLYIASYVDDTLPQNSTRILSIASLRHRADMSSILYD
jgi:hypothetical protein